MKRVNAINHENVPIKEITPSNLKGAKEITIARDPK
jgi:hypothetical protein